MDKEEKELSRFILEPKYREKVIAKIHKSEDKKYRDNIKSLESEKQKLLKLRQKEIIRIDNSRWEVLAGGKIRINRTEGKIKINDSVALFSNIKGAEVNIQNGFRIETKDNSKSKKHASLGGAIIGGVVAGPVGTVVGGVGLGKTKTKGNSVSNQIPTCTHIGILVNIDGFMSEITILSSQVDQSSFRYSSAYKEAQAIISKLRTVSQTPVPNTFIRIEEEKSVKDIDKQIAEAETKLKCAINEKPTYRLPDTYRTKEQEFMEDQEYLEYLRGEDIKRSNLEENNPIGKKVPQEEETKTRGQKINQSGLGVAALVLGIIGVMTACILIGILPCAIGLSLAIAALSEKNKKKGTAIAGLICSILGIIIFVFMMISAMISEETTNSTTVLRKQVTMLSIDVEYIE